MATEATINITSDITDSITFSIEEKMTMTKADGNIDLEETTGLAQRTFSGNTTQVVLIDVSAESVTASGANKVYIRNTTPDKDKHFKITLADTTDDTEEIGRLYGDDWMLMPWLATDANEDIMVQPSSSSKMTLEYAVFHQ
tara:strand:+ start:1070 stop:1492 length:423 start_codon:yes stop_codon:yes gene_type:complete